MNEGVYLELKLSSCESVNASPEDFSAWRSEKSIVPLMQRVWASSGNHRKSRPEAASGEGGEQKVSHQLLKCRLSNLSDDSAYTWVTRDLWRNKHLQSAQSSESLCWVLTSHTHHRFVLLLASLRLMYNKVLLLIEVNEHKSSLLFLLALVFGLHHLCTSVYSEFIRARWSEAAETKPGGNHGETKLGAKKGWWAL